MSKRMQNLILEILQAQPSLRDSKFYLNSFAPRRPPPPPPPQSHQHTQTQTPHQQPFSQHNTQPQHQQQQQKRHNQGEPYLEFPVPVNVAYPGSLHNPSTTLADPERAALSQATRSSSLSSSQGTPLLASQLPRAIREQIEQRSRSPSSSSTNDVAAPLHPQTQDHSTVAIPATTSTSDSLADSHTALVKIQGPFTDRQLDSIAEGLVYLKKLGLVSVCVVDHGDWSEFAAEVDQHGHYVVQSEELEQQRMEQWLHPTARGSTLASASSSTSTSTSATASTSTDKGKERFGSGLRPGFIGRKQERLRKRILADTLRLADALNRKGAMARPLPQAVVRVDARAAADVEREARPPHQSRINDEAHADALVAGGASAAAASATPTLHQGAADELKMRPPLVSDDSLASIRSALAANQIPVLAPFALYDNELGGTLDTLCVKADDVMVALTRDMVVAARRADAERERAEQLSGHDANDEGAGSSSALPYGFGGDVDLMPLRLMVINREGGIPSHARGGDPHLSINLASEHHQIKSSFIWSHSHPTALRNLDAISDCLSYMPQTSSGVLVTHRSPRSLIANLITNKAAHSPSLPHRLLANKKDVRHTPTIIRPGLPIRVLESFHAVDQDKLTALMEASFRRKLDRAGYFDRLWRKLDFVIVTGDYQGAAIVTRENAPDDDDVERAEPIAYLDKFAVLPSMQGSGTVDFLWGALRDEVQGLGLLDALNDNGGKGGYGRGRDLVWKSRSNNPVNKWYYERSNGFVRIVLDDEAKRRTAERAKQGQVATPAWQLFWCDAEDKLARLSGERKLAAGPSSALQEEESELWSDDEFARDAATGRGLLRPTSTADPLLTLLPIVAPEERGRLERWAKCMGTIPSAWKD